MLKTLGLLNSSTSDQMWVGKALLEECPQALRSFPESGGVAFCARKGTHMHPLRWFRSHITHQIWKKRSWAFQRLVDSVGPRTSQNFGGLTVTLVVHLRNSSHTLTIFGSGTCNCKNKTSYKTVISYHSRLAKPIATLTCPEWFPVPWRAMIRVNFSHWLSGNASPNHPAPIDLGWNPTKKDIDMESSYVESGDCKYRLMFQFVSCSSHVFIC